MDNITIKKGPYGWWRLEVNGVVATVTKEQICDLYDDLYCAVYLDSEPRMDYRHTWNNQMEIASRD